MYTEQSRKKKRIEIGKAKTRDTLEATRIRLAKLEATNEHNKQRAEQYKKDLATKTKEYAELNALLGFNYAKEADSFVTDSSNLPKC